MNKKLTATSFLFVWVGIYAIAMGFLESAVVVYLRAIYYPGGFSFPLSTMSGPLALTELWREAATVVMLLSVGMLASRKPMIQFAMFIYAFAIWDICYYLFLYILMGWPGSLLTWDLLFLIPMPWVGPVVAPIVNSMTMILLAVMITLFNSRGCDIPPSRLKERGEYQPQQVKKKDAQSDEKAKMETDSAGRFEGTEHKAHKAKSGKSGFPGRLRVPEWIALILGSIITIVAYTLDYVSYMSARFSAGEILTFNPTKAFLQFSEQYIPVRFNWYLFVLAELIFATVLFSYYHRNRKRPG